MFGVYGAVAGLAVTAGLLLGGLLVDADLFGLRWRAVFLINLPLAGLVLGAGAAVIPETRDHSAPRPGVAGMLLLGGSISAVTFVLLEGRTLG